MLWPILTAVALAALAGLYLRWRAKFARAWEALRTQVEVLQDEQRRAALQIQAQQEVLFSSMVEGLLLSDERGRISSSPTAHLRVSSV